MKIPSLLLEILPVHIAFAHCDVPCGIYDTSPSQIAARTVKTMVEKILALGKPQTNDVEYMNTFTRMIHTKEQHAEICKRELLILWTDFFKPEHLNTFPNLHETFWNAAKLCSYNKQHVDLEKAEELVQRVEEIATMFKDVQRAQ